MALAPKDRRALLILGSVAVVAAAVFFLVMVRGHGSGSAQSAGSATSLGSAAPSPTPASRPVKNKRPAQALVFSGRDPFDPAEGGGSVQTTAPDTGSSPAPTVSPAGSPAPVPSGGSSTEIGNDSVTLVDIFTGDGVQKAQIEVNGTVYTVAVGDSFGDGYTLDSISGSCVSISNSGTSTSLCEVANK